MAFRTFTVERTARVSELSEPGTQATIWICFHGYGELAENFIQKVSVLSDETTLVIAPEGLSRFYTKGGAGPVGASWMTKEDRLSEISDYCKYLDDVLSYYSKECKSLVSVNILGFSQGAATACRWYSQSAVKADNLVLWGAVFPPDMQIPDLESTQTRITLFAGKSDPYLKEEESKKFAGLVHEFIQYEGGHDILPEILVRLKRT